MLEAAMLRCLTRDRCRTPAAAAGSYVSGYGLGAAPSAEVAEARLIRSDTDWAWGRCAGPRRAVRAAASGEPRRGGSRREGGGGGGGGGRAAAARDALVAAANEALPDEPLRAKTASWTSR